MPLIDQRSFKVGSFNKSFEARLGKRDSFGTHAVSQPEIWEDGYPALLMPEPVDFCLPDTYNPDLFWSECPAIRKMWADSVLESKGLK